MAWLIPMH